ncbi:hypothetical protein ZWY2020_011425 [Hordeum vulgare]|nr:hypothetical protein ZWY2020_011425 [Hordeum vulgare]
MASSTVWQCLVALSLFSSAAYAYGYGYGQGNGYGGTGNDNGYGNGQLDPKFYEKSCPPLGIIVRVSMLKAVLTERRMGASLLRLFFHDCFVQGCDGSILLDDVPASNFTGEKTAFPNVNSVRGFEVIDDIKRNVEHVCPGVVSCADILALAAREGTVLLGGPSWAVPLGRRDSTTASLDGANSDLPGPALNLTELIQSFANKSLSPRDLTALSGAHTIGFSQCVFFRDHIYNDTNIDPAFAAGLRRCPPQRVSGDTNLTPLDAQTRAVQQRRQDDLVRQYSADSALFFADFVAAMIKMEHHPAHGKRRRDQSQLQGRQQQLRSDNISRLSDFQVAEQTTYGKARNAAS